MVAELSNTLSRRLEAGFRWYQFARLLEAAAVAAGTAFLVVASALIEGTSFEAASLTSVATIVGALACAATWIERRPTRRAFSALIDRREGFAGSLETAASSGHTGHGQGLGHVLAARVEQRFRVSMARRAAFATTLAFVAFALLCAAAWMAATERNAAGTGSSHASLELDARALAAAADQLDAAAATRSNSGAATNEAQELAQHARVLTQLARAAGSGASSFEALREGARTESAALRADLAQARDAETARVLRQALNALQALETQGRPALARADGAFSADDRAGSGPGREPAPAGGSSTHPDPLHADAANATAANSTSAPRDASSSVSSGSADGTMSGSTSSSASRDAGPSAPGLSSSGARAQLSGSEGGTLTSRWWAREHDDVVERWALARRRARDRHD